LYGFIKSVFFVIFEPLYYAFTLVQNQVRIPIIISLDIVLEGSSNDNLTKVIMETLTIGGGLLRNHNAQKLICFGANGVNVF
jgi:imidazole glycerol phosphate synthase subunit HisF